VHATLDIWPLDGETANPAGALTPAGTSPSELGFSSTLSPLYTCTIVDCSSNATTGTRYGVLLVPPGREHEYVFFSRAGLSSLGRSAGFCRIVAVAQGVGGRNSDRFSRMQQQEIQNELSAIVRTFFPASAGKIEYLAVASEGGRRTLIHEGCSKQSGVFVVEDEEVVEEEEEEEATVEDGGDDDDEEWQVPSVVLPKNTGGKGVGGRKRVGKGKKKKASKSQQQQQQQQERRGCVEKRPGVAAVRRLVFASNRAAVQSEVFVRGGAVIHSSSLRFSYHAVMADALRHFICAQAVGAPPPHTYNNNTLSSGNLVVVLGLGGGALPSHLAALSPQMFTPLAVELDPEVLRIAVSYFGLPLAAASPPSLNIEEDVPTLTTLLAQGGGGGGERGGRQNFPPPPHL